MNEDIYVGAGVVMAIMTLLLSAAILNAMAVRTNVGPTMEDQPAKVMDGSTAGANAVTMEEALVQAE